MFAPSVARVVRRSLVVLSLGMGMPGGGVWRRMAPLSKVLGWRVCKVQPVWVRLRRRAH